MNKVYGEKIGMTIGKVLEVDLLDDGIEWSRFLRIKIELKLHQALAIGRMTSVQGDKVWIPIKYEKLPKVYFVCGYLVHEADGCMSKSESLSQHAKKTQQFNSWLRAAPALIKRNYSNGKFSNGDGEKWKKGPV